MSRTTSLLASLPYVHTSGPSLCVLRNDRGHVAVYRPARGGYHKIVDRPLESGAIQFVEFDGNVGVHLAKGHIDEWALYSDSLSACCH